MKLAEVLAHLHAVRGDAVVITSMSTAREWQKLAAHPLDFVYVPSSMGQATSLGLGIALAQPERTVFVCTGDGSLLMNLGSLVTIAAENPPNLIILLFDNGVYEVTGGQPTPADHSFVRYAELAASCGFADVRSIQDLDQWWIELKTLTRANLGGPVFVHLEIDAEPDAGPIGFPGPAPARARALRTALVKAPGD